MTMTQDPTAVKPSSQTDRQTDRDRHRQNDSEGDRQTDKTYKQRWLVGRGGWRGVKGGGGRRDTLE